MSRLPATWVEAPLEDLFDFNPKHSPETPRDRLVSFVPMPAVDEVSGSIAAHENRPLELVWKGYTHFQDGDIIFAKITPCMENGKIAVASQLTNGLACGSTEFHVLRSKGAIDSTYTWRFLRQDVFRREAEAAMTGAVGQRRVPSDYLKKSLLPVPPENEQTRIVAKLDSLLSRSSRARHELDRVPLLIAHYKQAILVKALSGELTADWRAAHHAGEWKEGPAEQYFTWASGKFLPKSKQSPGQIPVYGGNGPNGVHDAAIVAEPTLVIGRVGAHCGNVHLTSGPAWVTDNAIYASEIAPTVDAQFARLVFTNANLNAAAGGSGQPFVNQTILNETGFPLPDLAEQREIIRLVQVASTWLEKIATQHARTEQLLPKLDQAFLAKAFRGELVPQDPNDEPADILLQRLKLDAGPKRRKS